MPGHADPSPIITIERHILDEQTFHPEATGVLTNILYDLALAGKVIASKTTRAGLAEILGRTGDINVQGETVLKLDRFADLTVQRLTDHTGRLAGLASEENDEFMPIPDKYPMGKYLLVFDPLDGSSNVDFNMPVGTIFGIYRRVKESGPRRLAGDDLAGQGQVVEDVSQNARGLGVDGLFIEDVAFDGDDGRGVRLVFHGASLFASVPLGRFNDNTLRDRVQARDRRRRSACAGYCRGAPSSGAAAGYLFLQGTQISVRNASGLTAAGFWSR